MAFFFLGWFRFGICRCCTSVRTRVLKSEAMLMNTGLYCDSVTIIAREGSTAYKNPCTYECLNGICKMLVKSKSPLCRTHLMGLWFVILQGTCDCILCFTKTTHRLNYHFLEGSRYVVGDANMTNLLGNHIWFKTIRQNK